MSSEGDALLRGFARLLGREVARAAADEFMRLNGALKASVSKPALATRPASPVPEPGEVPTLPTASERFWSKVDKTDGCWLWKGATQNGYGIFYATLGRVIAHRFAYEELVGSIPPGKVVMHTCDRRNCVNPEHLRLGTPSDNIADMVAKGRHARGDSSGTSRLTVDHVRHIRASGESHRSLARRYHVGLSTIRNVRARRSWKHIVD